MRCLVTSAEVMPCRRMSKGWHDVLARQRWDEHVSMSGRSRFAESLGSRVALGSAAGGIALHTPTMYACSCPNLAVC